MSKVHYSIVALAAAFCVVLAVSPASAYIINLTTNTPVFYDNFENQPADKISHLAYPDNMDARPVGPVLYGGWWSDLNAALDQPRQVQVTDFDNGTAAGPGAYEGDNYLRLARRSTGGDQFVMVCENFDPSSFAAGEIFHWERMLYVSVTGSNSYFVRVVTENQVPLSANNPSALIEIKINGANVENNLNNSTSSVKIAGLPDFTYAAWHKLEIDYVLGEETWDVTFDGLTVTDLAVNNIGYKDERLTFTAMRAGPNTSVALIDETFTIPEPSTFALLGLGLVGLLAYAWRRRK